MYLPTYHFFFLLPVRRQVDLVTCGRSRFAASESKGRIEYMYRVEWFCMARLA